MRMTDAGIKLIVSEEGIRTKAYPDPESPLAKELQKPEAKRKANWSSLDGSPWTIGIGETGPGIGPNTVWTEEFVWSSFYRRLNVFEDNIREILSAANVSLTDNQFSAITSFCWNVGIDEFKTSTMLKKLASGDVQGAADEFSRWNKSRGKVIPDLVARRDHERSLFLTP